MKFNRFIEISKALYKPSPLRTFHTTFIIENKRIVSIGINNIKTHPLSLKYAYRDDQRSIHSELSAILKLGYEDCSDLTFVNVRLTKDLTVANSKPCQGCIDMLKQVGFKKLFYTANENSFIAYE